MKTKPFHAYFFEVESLNDETDHAPADHLSDVMDRVIAQPLNDRIFEIGGVGRRLEHCDVKDKLYFLNFLRLDFAGPGRAKIDKPPKDINMARDEYFSTETAMLYDPDGGLAFIESSRPGTGANAISEYFGHFAMVGGYCFTPRLDPDAAARFRAKKTIRSINLRAAMGSVTKFDEAMGMPVAKIFGEDFGARQIDLKISVGRGRNLGLIQEQVVPFIERMMRQANENDIEKLEVVGTDDDGPSEIIDLIQHREQRTENLEVDPNTRRIPVDARWATLKKFHRDYLQS